MLGVHKPQQRGEFNAREERRDAVKQGAAFGILPAAPCWGNDQIDAEANEGQGSKHSAGNYNARRGETCLD